LAEVVGVDDGDAAGGGGERLKALVAGQRVERHVVEHRHVGRPPGVDAVAAEVPQSALGLVAGVGEPGDAARRLQAADVERVDDDAGAAGAVGEPIDEGRDAGGDGARVLHREQGAVDVDLLPGRVEGGQAAGDEHQALAAGERL